MHMAPSKTKFAKLEPAGLKFTKGRSARANMGLLEKTIEPALCHEHHRDPVVPRVATDMFKASASYVCHVCISIALRRRASGARLWLLPNGMRI